MLLGKPKIEQKSQIFKEKPLQNIPLILICLRLGRGQMLNWLLTSLCFHDMA